MFTNIEAAATIFEQVAEGGNEIMTSVEKSKEESIESSVELNETNRPAV